MLFHSYRILIIEIMGKDKAFLHIFATVKE